MLELELSLASANCTKSETLEALKKANDQVISIMQLIVAGLWVGQMFIWWILLWYPQEPLNIKSGRNVVTTDCKAEHGMKYDKLNEK